MIESSRNAQGVSVPATVDQTSRSYPPFANVATWQTLIDAMLHAVWLVDPGDLCIVAANRAAGELAGLPVAQLIGMQAVALTPAPQDICFWGEVAEGLSDSIESETFAVRLGRAVPVTRRVSRVDLAAGGSLFVVALHDRSEQVRVERDLEDVAADLRATLESTQDGILVTDLGGRIRNFNRHFAALWDVPQDMLTQRDDDAVFEWMRRSVTEPSAYMHRLAVIDDAATLECSDDVHLRSGRILERVVTPQRVQGRLIGRVYSFRDITEKTNARQRIETLSFTDALTGLPNRRLLVDRIEQSLAMAGRDGTSFALLFLNLDRFNHINETLGRTLGDRVLLDVAGRVKTCMRQADTVARLGGDEFIVLAHQSDEIGAEASALRLIDALKQPFSQGGMNFTVTASIGIALYPNDGSSMEELVRRADAAMREVKIAGRAGFRFHRPRPAHADDHLRSRSRSRLHLDHAMRQALAQGKFRLHYQPQVELASGKVVGAEALIRWHDTERGEVSPGEFIPVAEQSGFILLIDHWVLRQAATQAALWLSAGKPMVVSVNVSGLQFQQPGFVDSVAQALREANLPAHWIELELTESILIQDAQDAMLRLQALAQLGVKLAIDDFGIGYSSLAYLKRFPIGRLKIDRSFISGLPGEESDAGIVEAIINMGRALRLQIVAEGVETDAQRQFLERCGCDLYQGFLYAPALAPDAFEARVGLAPSLIHG